MQTEPMQSGIHGFAAPSSWVRQWADSIPPAGNVLDLASGSGRHSLWLARRGYKVLAVDRDGSALASFAGTPGIATLEADLESGSWALQGRTFEGIVVTNYLHRPLFPRILEALADGGVLIYETFAEGNERFGKPSNPDFLLRRGELLDLVRGRLNVLAFEDLEVTEPKPAMVQRICARADSRRV